MEVFSIFATFSLVDMISGPLGGIGSAMKGVQGVTASLSDRMGRLALALAPVALGAGLLIGALGMAASKAMAFESAMADVAKVVNFDSQSEFTARGNTIKDMAGRIPMAADGIAAIIAAAGQSGIAKADLAEFAEQAAKMGVAFDLTGDQAGKMMADWRAGMNLALPRVYALADAVNYLSNNMNASAPALGEVIQRVGAAAMACGLGETQVAALGAAFLSAGASPEIASTALKKFTTTLVKGTAMSKEQAAAFQGLGFSATQMAKDMQTDAQGTIFKVLQALANKPKELQMSLLTQMFGEEAIGAIAPLLQNMGNLTLAFDSVADASAYAGSMQGEFDTRSKTTQNALQLLTNKLTNLAISLGSIFLPAISWAAVGLGHLADALRWCVETELGQWLVGATGALATAVLVMTAFTAAGWAAGAVGPYLAKTLLPLKTMLLGLGWPVWALIAAGAALYVAYRANFGGIADVVNRWWRTITLVVRGVTAVLQSLKGNVGEVRGVLARDIDAAGLTGLVTTVARVVYRIKEFFSGILDGLNMDGAVSALTPAILIITDTLSALGDSFDAVFGVKVGTATGQARSLGQMVGGVLSWGLEALATVITNVVRGVDTLVSAFRWLAAVLTGDWATASDMAWRIWDNFCASLMGFADLFRLGDWVRAAWADAQNWLGSINLYDSGAALLDTFIQGIMAKAGAVKDSVMGVLQDVRNLLPFSDAKEGPLSALTASGAALVGTLGEGVDAGRKDLLTPVLSTLADVDSVLAEGVGPLPKLDFSSVGAEPELRPSAFAQGEEDAPRRGKGGAGADSGAGRTLSVHIENLTLPDVTDARGFVDALQNLVAEYEGAEA